ncbi:MAG: nitroreductase family protein [Proteobacteria bacterium]|nr:nitroreductase family protein [Pseudomonadota bacterium]
MEKSADAKYPLHPLIAQRWSPRAFSEKAIEKESIMRLLEAARWAPSCFNEQPWHFIIATKDNAGEFEKLLSCLMEGNITWAKKAPMLIISVAKTHFDHNGKENRHAFHDIGLAVENMTLQGMDLGIYVHQMAGFYADKAKSTFNIPEGYEPVTAIAIGYPGDPQTLTEELRTKELERRTRKPLEGFVFTGDWNKPSPMLKG